MTTAEALIDLYERIENAHTLTEAFPEGLAVKYLVDVRADLASILEDNKAAYEAALIEKKLTDNPVV